MKEYYKVDFVTDTYKSIKALLCQYYSWIKKKLKDGR